MAQAAPHQPRDTRELGTLRAARTNRTNAATEREMIIAVAVEMPDPKSDRQRFACRDENRARDTKWRCGKCLRGLVSPCVGDTCKHCGARVAHVDYDTVDHERRREVY